MVIEHFSENMSHLKLKVSGLQYANIEIRPKGIIIHINQGYILMLGPFHF